ncbi:MFS transporter [Streptomyces sp. BI20]|uniref:MFS transporter n=1 Tax=Streptomyces sp. BI20 TaxID=3403460 RepID=UPI003C783733
MPSAPKTTATATTRNTPAAPSPAALSSRAKALALGVLSAGLLTVILDGSIVTVAMPALQADLGFTPAGLSWVVNAYLIAFGGLLLFAGRLGDLIGRRRMFLAGTTLFTGASVLAGFAGSTEVLIAARFLQGAGSAMASAVSLGILITLFTEARERARAIAVFSFTGAAGASIGQVLGGVLTDALSWHWIFFINVPIGAVILGLTFLSLPDDRGPGLRAGVDLPGALLVTGGLMLTLHTVVGIEAHGVGSARTLGLGALSLALLVGFVIRQATARNPLLPLRVLRSRAVAGANLVQVLMIAALFGFQILVALHLQQVSGYGATATGLAMLPAALAIGAVSLGVSARLIGRFGERAVLLTGLVMLVGVLGLLTRVPAQPNYSTDLLPVMLLAAGFGLALPALTGLGMSGARPEDAGLASGLFNTTQQIGMALGVAVLSTLASGRAETLTAAGATRAEALTGGHHLAFGVGAGLVLAALLVAATVLRDPAGTRPANEDTTEAPATTPRPITA